MIYVFRHNGKDGVLRVPFDEIFFHLGESKQSKHHLDLRGEVLDGDIVTDTFAVGEMMAEKIAVAEIWEFILRYMERGPESLDCKYLNGSTSRSWHNAYLYSAGRVGPLLTKLFFPLIMLTTLTRWLVMKSCKTPRWPADVEAECAVDPNDPYDLPQPSHSGEFLREEDFRENLARYRARNKK